MLIIRLDWTWTEIIWNGIAILVRLGLRQIYCIFLFYFHYSVVYIFFPTLVCKINVFVLAKHRTHIARWSSLAWNPMHHTTIHKKYIKFKFCWNYFSFFRCSLRLFALCYISLFDSFGCSEYWWCCCFSICLLGYMYVCVICGGASGMSGSHRGASNCHWCRSFMRTNIIFIHSIELCSWLPEKFLPLNSGVSSFSHTNAKRF